MKAGEIFEKRKILVCCGSGGVGKTTLSAALALEAARRGRKAIVLTIDPAKRLATALGLEELSNEPVEIDFRSLLNEGGSPSGVNGEIVTAQMGGAGWRAATESGYPTKLGGRGSTRRWEPQGGSPPAAYRRPLSGGRLYAMMLDTKRTFDRLIEKYAPSPERRDAILSNQLYRHMSNMIAGSQEYMAMEKLHEIYQEGSFDLLVLDTPPTRHALDFLEAPQKMVNITGNSLLKWFLKPGLLTSKAGGKILTVFDRLAGFSFLRELAEMISLIGNLLGGFHERAEAVYKLLRGKKVGFLLITSPSSVSIQDALYFYQKIRGSDLPFLGFLVNRVHEDGRAVSSAGDLLETSPGLREKILLILKEHEQSALRDERAITLLKKMGGRNTFLAKIPLMTSDIHDLKGLMTINEALFR